MFESIELFAGIPVRDYAAGRAWYERFFGREPDMLPNDNEAVWHLPETGSVYVVGDPERAGNALLALIVEDVDPLLADLAERGLTPDSDTTIPGTVREVPFTDPDGNTVKFGQPLG